MEPVDTVEEPSVKQEPGVQVVQDGENLVLPTECVKESKDTGDVADIHSGSRQYRNTEYGEMECQKSLREPISILISKQGRSRCSSRNRGENLIHRQEENVQNEENCTSLPRHELDCICAEKQRHTSLCKRMKKLFIDCQHKCPSCGAMFPNISDLMSHLEYHRNQTNHAKKSKRLRGAEDVQVVPKKCKSDAKSECRDFGTAVKVKQEIDIWDEESWSEPDIGQEMRGKFHGNSSPNEGHERNSKPLLRNHQPMSTEQQNERTTVKKHQRRVNSYQGENQSAGTVCGPVKDPLNKLDSHINTDTKEEPEIIDSCSTEFSITNYIRKLSKCSICDDVFSLPELLRSHYMTKHPTSCYNTGDAREVTNNIENNDIKFLTGKNVLTEKVNAGELKESEKKQKTFNEVTNVHSECDICGEKLNFPGQYKRHVLIKHVTEHVGEAGTFFKCNICGEKCSRRDTVGKHMTRHTARERSFKCETCHKSFYRKGDLDRHNKIHCGVFDFTCDMCDKRFRHKRSFQKHKTKHTIEEPSTCLVLDKNCESPVQKKTISKQDDQSVLDKNCESPMQKETISKQDDQSVLDKNCESPVQKETISKQDDEPNTLNRTLKHISEGAHLGNKGTEKQSQNKTSTDHIVEQNELVDISQCETSVNNNKLDAMEEQMKVFSCNSEMMMENHQQETFNEDIGAYSVCDICGEKLHSPIQYKRHIMTRHVTKHVGDSGTIFKCDICRQKCSRKDALERHMKRHTARERSFKCETCGKGFYRKDDLFQHMKTHRSVFEYTCDICMKGFRKKRSLRSHTSKHTAEEQSACTIIRNNCERPVQKEPISKTDDELKSSSSTYEHTPAYENVYKRVGNKEIATQNNGKETSADNIVDIDHEELMEVGLADQCYTSAIHNQNVTEKLTQSSGCNSESLIENHKQKVYNKDTNAYSGCCICDERFNSRSVYKSHILTRHATTNVGESGTFFKCNICEQKCSRKVTVEKHMTIHTLRKRSFKCETCGKGFYRKGELANHVKTHSGMFEYTCDICMKGFHDKRSLQSHLSKHILEIEEPSECTNIRKSCERPVQNGTISKTDESKSSISTSEYTSTRENVCENARDGEFGTQNGKKASADKAVDSEELVEISQSDQSETSVINSNINARDMENHKQKASNDDTLLNAECYICGEILSTHESISSHVTATHAVIIERSDGFYKCVCKICGKKCFQKDMFEKHMRTHIAMKCGICGKVCNTSVGYSSHILAEHVTEKTGESGTFFECNICGVKLSYKKFLKRHLAKHTKNDLAKHTKKGKQFKCMTCGKGFVKRKELKAHQRVHDGECKYKCDICGIKFIHSKSLCRHMKEHTTNGKRNRGKMSTKSSEYIKELETHFLSKTVSQHEKDIDKSSNIKTCNNVKDPQIEFSTRNVEKPTTDKIAKEIDQLDTSVVIGINPSLETEFSTTSHMQKPSNDSKNANACECGICGEIFILTKQLKSHLLTQHATIEDKKGKWCKVSCNVCGKTFKKLCYAEQHLAKHTKRERSFKCKTCYRGFFTKGGLTVHEKIHSRIFEYACDICMKGFHKKTAYQNHMAKHFCRESYDRNTTTETEDNFEVVTGSELEKYSCSEIILENEKGKPIDKEISQMTNEERCDSQFELEQHIALVNTYEYNCDICSKGFEVNSCFKRHMRKHWIEETYACAHFRNSILNSSCTEEHPRNTCQDGGKLFVAKEADIGEIVTLPEKLMSHHATLSNSCKCNVCGKTFHKKDFLLRHLDVHANSERTLKCKINGEGCFQQSEPDGDETTERNVYEYSCDICSSGFKEKEAFRIHIKTHLDDKSFTCKECGDIFPSKGRLWSHKNRNHTNNPYSKYSKCDICNKMVSEGNRKKHQQTHIRNPAHKCDICEKQLGDLRSLKGHRKLHTGEYTYVCEVCGKGFVNKIPYERHVAEHTGSRDFECDVCGGMFYLNSSLKQHKKAMHSTREKKIYQCDGCGKVYLVKRNFEQHIKSHRETANFKCDTCSKSFHLEKILKQHLLTHKARTNICDICGKAYSSFVVLREHIKNIHGVKDFTCDKCGKSCENRILLRLHMRCHLNEGLSANRYLCEFCGKRYGTHSELHQHQCSHRGYVEKPYKCKTCNAQFFFPGKLKSHEQTHSDERPFACDICGKRYKSTGARLAHRKLHTKERSNRCGECGQMFITKKSLMEHSWIHSGKKPYQCKICGDKFRHNGTLYRHNALVHKKKKTIS